MSYNKKMLIVYSCIILVVTLFCLFEPNRKEGVITSKYLYERWNDTNYFFILDSNKKTEVSDKTYWKHNVGEYFNNKNYK